MIRVLLPQTSADGTGNHSDTSHYTLRCIQSYALPMQMTMASSGDKDEVDINMQMFSSLIYPSFSEISSGVGGVDSVCFKGDA